MKLRYLTVLLVGALAAMVPLTAVNAQTDEVLMTMDFEDGVLPNEAFYFLEETDWEVTSEPQSEGMVLVGDSSASDYASLTIVDSYLWESYRIEFLMNLSEKGYLFVGTHSDPDIEACITGHTFTVSFDDQSMGGYSTSTDCQDTEFDYIASDGFTFGDWVTLTMDVTLNSMAVYVDGEEILNGATGDVPVGFLTLGAVDGAVVQLDSIVVTPLDSVAVASTGSQSSGTRGLPADLGKGGEDSVALEDFGGDYQDAIAELQALDLVPSGGKLLFVEDYAYFQGAGSWFTPLAENSPNTDIVMAGEITFNAAAGGDVLEHCMLTARLVQDRNGDTTTFAGVMLFNDGWVVATDIIEEETSNSAEQDLGLTWDGETHDVLFTMIDDLMNVYIDGQPVIEDLAVEVRDGTFGIALRGEDAKSRCEGRNIWVYTFD